jgi:ATP-dependent HslUV protease ATP-binding subunit HslU
MKIEQLTPREIVNELDKYIIGQAEAKRNVAIALRNRWRRMNATEEMKGEIIPNNILMIGPTGVGKTEIARRLAKLADAPFVKVEASKFTEVGYVGRDVESMVRDLVEQAVNMIRLRKKDELKTKAMQAVEDILLDLLIPPLVNPHQKTNENEAFNGFNLKANETVSENEDIELNHKTREKFREKLRLGQLEDKKVELETNQPTTANVGFIGGPQGMMDDNSLQGLQDAISGMFPKNKKKKKYTISEARKILLDDEVSKLIDMDDVKSEAVEKCENTGIIFIDEIDKIARNGNKGTSVGDVSREGVQRDLLPIVEGTAVNTKYGVVNTDHILFIAAGAFHFAKPSDLIPELQGRFPIRVELNSLTKEDFTKILSTPKNSLTKQYFALMQSEGVELAFEESAIEKISEIATEINAELENIGARRLHTVMSTLLNEFLFDIPENIPLGSKLNITSELVDKKLSSLVKNRDLSKYIL